MKKKKSNQQFANTNTLFSKKKIYEIQVKSEIQPPLDSNFNFVATHSRRGVLRPS